MLLDSGNVAGREALAFAGSEPISVKCCGDFIERERIQQPINPVYDFCVGHPDFPGPQRVRQSYSFAGASSKAEMKADVFATIHGYVFDQQTDHTLAIAVVGVRIFPETWKILRKRED